TITRLVGSFTRSTISIIKDFSSCSSTNSDTLEAVCSITFSASCTWKFSNNSRSKIDRMNNTKETSNKIVIASFPTTLRQNIRYPRLLTYSQRPKRLQSFLLFLLRLCLIFHAIVLHAYLLFLNRRKTHIPILLLISLPAYIPCQAIPLKKRVIRILS